MIDRMLRGLLAALLLAVAAPALSQSLGKPAAPAAPAAPADPWGRTSPRGLANGLIAALAAQDYERAGHYFDLSGVAASRRDTVGAEDARKLQEVLDGGGSLSPFLQLPDDPIGRVDDGLPPNQERIGTLTPATDTREEVPLIATSTQQNGAAVWQISAASIAALPAAALLAERSGRVDRLREHLPHILTDTQLAGAPLSDWLILLVAAIVFYLAVRLLFALALGIVGRVQPDHEHSRVWRVLYAASSPLSVNIAMLLFLQATQSAQVAIVARQFVSRFAGAVLLLSLAWFLWRLADVVTDLVAMRMQRTERFRARSVLIFMRRALKLLLLAFGAVAALDALGINVTTGIAALGLGGLAIALGAQKTVENIVGSVSIIADEPVRVGDFCKVGDVVGTVEDIGIRSTRIRTNERTRVTIPNGNFSSMQIENFSLRDRYLFNPTLNLTYDLDADGVARVLEAVRGALRDADYLMEGARATFAGFGASSLDIDIFSWINVPDFTESLYLKEKLLLEIMRRVEAAGGNFAFPTTAVHIDSADGLARLASAAREAQGSVP